MQKLLQIENLTKVYGSKESQTVALDQMSFDVLKGEFLGIIGQSGSGKTTLINCIATMIKPTAGEIYLKEKPLSSLKGSLLADYRGNKIGYLFQEFELLDHMTVRENIALPLNLHNISQREVEKSIAKAAGYFDIKEILDKFPTQLSGGQKQRAAAARSLVSNSEIILADEPTGALDSKNARILLERLLKINQEEKKTIMMVTHDAGAASFCSRILFVQDGKIFHELRKKAGQEEREAFYHRILMKNT